MIRFNAVTKRYSPQTAPAVDGLDLEIDDGALTVLVGPSGCGKTTSLRMINRLEDLTEGSISIDDQDIMAIDRTQLRRGIGYVMQHSGLFPHRTIRANIATVPTLLRWNKTRIAERVEQLTELVGLTTDMLDRYPHALSGGQQQRVGVARALAADPPIMLMDEPFAAVDPIVRGRLQDEFLRLQRQLNKTIVFVTHDIDEAIKIGDRIAMFEQGGRLAQHDTPAEILAAPASEFVTDFLGAERELKRLALKTVAGIESERGPVVAVGDSGESARSTAAHHDSDWVVVIDPEERLQGWLPLDALDDGSIGNTEARAFKYTVTAEDSLRAALNAMVASRIGVAPRLDADGRYEGMVTQAGLSRELL